MQSIRSMFDIEQFYRRAHYGEPIDKDEVFRYISSFQNVILWGAGNLGTAVGKVLLSGGVSILEYWDLKADEIVKCNEIPVKMPFSHQYDVEKTLIISCIANGSLGEQWPLRTIQRNGYSHHLLGMELFEGLNCAQTYQDFDIRRCTGTRGCSLTNCVRYTNLLQGQNSHSDKKLIFQVMVFSISSLCTLNCKYCGQGLEKYPTRKNYDKADIFRDIDNMMSSVDFVGMLSLIGGEPFIHPDIAEIVEKALEWENIGVVNITTNGVFRVSKDTIRRLNHPRVLISFSCYDPYLTEAQEAVLQQNIDLVRETGITYSLSHPLWSKPQEIKKYHSDVSYMEKRKAGCDPAALCSTVRNGVYAPCTLAERMSGQGHCGIEEDLVDVTVREGLRERLIENRNKPFYQVCAYCSDKGSVQVPAGEQIGK